MSTGAEANHDSPALRYGFERCRRATRATGEIEYATSLLLPPPLRVATWALYGAVRAVDDLADTPGVGASDRTRLLEEWISAFDADMRDGRSADPVRHALIHTTLTWNLSTAFLHTLFEELRQDVHRREFATWQEWRRYSSLINTPLVLRTASLLIRAAVCPSNRKRSLPAHRTRRWRGRRWWTPSTSPTPSSTCPSDLTRGHVPLPAEALDEAGVRREDLLARRPTPAFERMVHQLTAQARQWFDQAVLPPVLHPAIGIAIGTYRDLYRLRLSLAARHPETLVHRRPALPWHGVSSWLLPPAPRLPSRGPCSPSPCSPRRRPLRRPWAPPRAEPTTRRGRCARSVPGDGPPQHRIPPLRSAPPAAVRRGDAPSCRGHHGRQRRWAPTENCPAPWATAQAPRR